MTGTGTFTDPIIAMSADPAQIVRDVRASLAFYGRTDDAYWLEKAGRPAEFSNHLWHLGWNRYWEARADPTNTGSADPNLGRQPAVNQSYVVSVPDAVHAGTWFPQPPPIVTPLPDLSAIEARLARIEALLAKGFSGTVKTRFSTTAVTLKPTP